MLAFGALRLSMKQCPWCYALPWCCTLPRHKRVLNRTDGAPPASTSRATSLIAWLLPTVRHGAVTVGSSSAVIPASSPAGTTPSSRGTIARISAGVNSGWPCTQNTLRPTAKISTGVRAELASTVAASGGLSTWKPWALYNCSTAGAAAGESAVAARCQRARV